MSRNIDANKLMQDIDERGADFWCSSVDICNAKKIVAEQPSADVRKVVRCKDCKHCMKADKYELWCAGHGYPHRLTTADDFCSKGERI